MIFLVLGSGSYLNLVFYYLASSDRGGGQYLVPARWGRESGFSGWLPRSPGCGWVCHYRCVSVAFQGPCWYHFGRERNRHLMTVLQLPSTDTGWQRGSSYCGVVAEIPTVHCTHLAPPLPLLGRQRNAVLPLGDGGSPGCLCDLGPVSAFPLAWSETTRWQQEGEVLGHLVTVWWGGSVNSVFAGRGRGCPVPPPPPQWYLAGVEQSWSKMFLLLFFRPLVMENRISLGLFCLHLFQVLAFPAPCWSYMRPETRDSGQNMENLVKTLRSTTVSTTMSFLDSWGPSPLCQLLSVSSVCFI